MSSDLGKDGTFTARTPAYIFNFISDGLVPADKCELEIHFYAPEMFDFYEVIFNLQKDEGASKLPVRDDQVASSHSYA